MLKSLPSYRARASYEPGEVIVKLRDQPQVEESLQDQFGASLVERFDFGHGLRGSQGDLARFKLPQHLSVEEAVELFSEHPGIEYAEPNHRYYLEEPLPGDRPADLPAASKHSGAPDDLHYLLWGLENRGQTRGKPGADISVKEAWKLTHGDRKNGPILAVIDTGVDVTHPDLVDNLWVNKGEIPGDGIDNDGNGVVDDVYGYNAFHHNNDLSDLKVHGTHVAGTVGAVGNNGQGITGVAQEAQIMTVRIFGETGHTNQATVLRGLAYADRMGARLTTNSWGGIHSKAMEEAFASSPALHFASAGNSARNNDLQPHYPSSYEIDNMVAVAATDHKDVLGSFSCYGAQSVDLAAPGQNIYSTMPGHRYKNFSGTSMATPHVAGVASLILTQYPEASNAEVKERLLASVDPLPSLQGTTVSGGRLNAASALEDDSIPPAAVQDFRAQASPSSVTLNWLDTGDDVRAGKASRLELRSAPHPLDEGNFQEGELRASPAPDTAGTLQSREFRFPLSKESRTLHYALRAIDNVGNPSPLARAQAIIPSAKQVFEDHQDQKWTAEGQWSKVVVAGHGEVWTDSPEGQYESDTEQSLISPRISLKETSGNVLRFQCKSDLERGDFLRLQVSGDGKSWRNTYLQEGRKDWEAREIDLSRYDGQDLQLKFIFKSDSFSKADGVYISGIEVLGEAIERGSPKASPSSR